MKIYAICLLFICFLSKSYSQVFTEVTQPLSAKSIKGYLYSYEKDEDGTNHVTYKMKLNKNNDDVAFEEFKFDRDLKFLGTEDAREKKVDKPDYERTAFYASVGGSTSFDVMSMKLRLRKIVSIRTWDNEYQRYELKKTILNEAIRPKNDSGKNYLGLASFNSFKEDRNDVCILAKTESEEKNAGDNYYILHFDDELEINEFPIELKGNYILIYSDQLANDNVVMIFAPRKGSADISNYIFLEYNMSGEIQNQIAFKSPASAMVITSMSENEGAVFFYGSSAKSDGSYDEEFGEYASISSPGFIGAENTLDMRWEKRASEKMDNFHLIKISGKSLDFATTIPVKEFKAKMKTAPGDKGSTPYEGKKFFIEKFVALANGELLIAGQLSSRVTFAGTSMKAYQDIVCFHFSNEGTLKAQYGIGKMNNDKNSEIFPMLQHFYISDDGKSAYWEMFEIQGENGYAGFSDAYNGVKTFYALYFPRICKINLENNSLDKIHIMGDGKYFLRKLQPKKFDSIDNSVTYIGHDQKWKTLWLGKMKLE
jgi:hypothetical protein